MQLSPTDLPERVSCTAMSGVITPVCHVAGGIPLLVAMLTQYDQAATEAFHMLEFLLIPGTLPADQLESAETLLVRLQAAHRICHVLAACLPPVRGGRMMFPGTDGRLHRLLQI